MIIQTQSVNTLVRLVGQDICAQEQVTSTSKYSNVEGMYLYIPSTYLCGQEHWTRACTAFFILVGHI